MPPTQPSHRVLKHSLGVLASYSLLYLLFFGPVLFSNRVLAPGDGIIYFLPNFVAHRALWEPMIWGGFPAIGDSQLMLWYPPALLFSLVGYVGYQPFILLAYILASSFTYGYVFASTRSRLAAAISGCVYGMCGFMVAHVGHASMLQSAAWLPLMVWSVGSLRRDVHRGAWFVIATIAIAFDALAGHPQIFIYAACLTAICAIFNGFESGGISRSQYFLDVIAAFALGGGLAAIQLWPTSELTSLTWRAALNFPEFVAYELPLRQLPVLIFPYLYGGSPASMYRLPYFGAWPSSLDGWGAGELSGYVGLFTLLLAAIGVVTYWRNHRVVFWLAIAVVTLLLTLGDATPLARIIYHVPILNKFRVPARHFVQLTFSFSVLAGYGVSALQRKEVPFHVLRNILIGSALFVLLCVTSLLVFSSKVNELAIQRLGHTVSLKPWTNPALAIPLSLFVIECFVLFYWSHSPESTKRAALALVILIVDLASFGWFCEWHYRSPYKAYVKPPAAAESLRAQIEGNHQRMLPIRGGTGYVNELPPNLSKLWQLPSASGYGPFIHTRLSNLLTMPPHGSVDDSWRDPANQGLNLMAVRYVVLPPDKVEATSMIDEKGTRWAGTDLGVEIGVGCNPKNALSYELEISEPVPATSILVVGALACSVQLADDQEVSLLIVTDNDGHSYSYPILAGRDLSEWAFDCSDVTPVIKHRRAQVFRSYGATRGAVSCQGHDYVARIQFDKMLNLRRVEVRWTGPAGTFVLKKLTAQNEKTSTPITSIIGSLADTSRWRPMGRIDATNSGYSSQITTDEQGVGLVFENLAARPRAWLVPEVISLTETEVFNAVRSSRLPDGSHFDPARIALVEEPVEFHQQQDSGATARIIDATSRSMVVQTSSAFPTFLVTSDVFYPGWLASVDGEAVEIRQTDYALRGVAVPAGSHEVRFEFEPRSLYYGSIVSLLSLILIFVRITLTRSRLVRDN